MKLYSVLWTCFPAQISKTRCIYLSNAKICILIKRVYAEQENICKWGQKNITFFCAHWQIIVLSIHWFYLDAFFKQGFSSKCRFKYDNHLWADLYWCSACVSVRYLLICQWIIEHFLSCASLETFMPHLHWSGVHLNVFRGDIHAFLQQLELNTLIYELSRLNSVLLYMFEQTQLCKDPLDSLFKHAPFTLKTAHLHINEKEGAGLWQLLARFK